MSNPTTRHLPSSETSSIDYSSENKHKLTNHVNSHIERDTETNLSYQGIFKDPNNKHHIIVVAKAQPNKPQNYSTEPYSHPIEVDSESDDDYLENLNYRIIEVPPDWWVGNGKGNNCNNYDDSNRKSRFQIKPRNVRRRPKPYPGRKPTFGVYSKGISNTSTFQIKPRNVRKRPKRDAIKWG